MTFFKLPLMTAVLLTLFVMPALAADEFGVRFANVMPKAFEGESTAPVAVAAEKTFSPEQLNEIAPASGEAAAETKPDPIPVTPYQQPVVEPEQIVDTGE